jgi:cysteine desulfurase family protein (TIGR01976 family)
MATATRGDERAPTPDLDLEWVRAQFPALAGDWVLMDNAGGSAPLASVIDRIAAYMGRWPVQLGATYGASAEAAEHLTAARRSLAGLMATGGGEAPAPEEVVVASSTTELMQRLARAIGAGLGPGDEIVVTEVDHEANISPWRRLAAQGVGIREWPLNRDTRRLEATDLEPLLNERTRLVCFTHASNLLGEVTPVAEITAMAHECGAQVVVDGVAYAPHRPLAVKAWGVDYYAFSLYKVYGPHCALLYGRREHLDRLPNLNHGFYRREDVPGKLEPGAYPYELLYGAGAVPDYFDALGRRVGGEGARAAAYGAIAAHERRLTTMLLDYLDGRAGATVCGTTRADGARLPTISFEVAGRASSTIPPACDAEGIGIRWGHFYAPRLVDALGLTERDGVVRVSMVHYNTEDEVRRLTEVLDRAW